MDKIAQLAFSGRQSDSDRCPKARLFAMYSDDPPLSAMPALSLLRRDPAGGVPALFRGRRAAYAWNTRVALRQGCNLLGLRPGDEVLAPAYNCGSEIDPLLQMGLTVRLYPVTPETDAVPEEVERLISPRTRAIYLTHYFGRLQPARHAFRALCDRHGLRLIEDCALSLLSGHAPAEGRCGDIALFCCYKFFPVIGGGILVVNGDTLPEPPGFDRPPPAGPLARALLRGLAGPLRRKMRRGADALPSPAGAQPDMPGHYYFDPSLRDRRIFAPVLRALGSVDVAATIRRRRDNALALQVALDGMVGVTPLWTGLDAETCPLGLPVLVAGRDTVAARLTAQGVPVPPWWAGYHRGLDWTGAGTTEARRLKDGLLLLPVHQGLGATDMARIAACLAAATKP